MISGTVDDRRPERRRVRVWFGEHVIAQHIADAPLAERYEQAMRRRFAGLRVTNDLVGVTSCPPAAGDS